MLNVDLQAPPEAKCSEPLAPSGAPPLPEAIRREIERHPASMGGFEPNSGMEGGSEPVCFSAFIEAESIAEEDSFLPTVPLVPVRSVKVEVRRVSLPPPKWEL